jgi:hypothetical protein
MKYFSVNFGITGVAEANGAGSDRKGENYY